MSHTNSDQPFYIIEPKGPKVPFILSVPHSGTAFPDELKDHYIDDMRDQPDDTDWFVHQLYDFASEMGITTIHAKYSRWVIDLNRDPDSVPLYNDGRLITGLTTSTDFLGNPIYKSDDLIPDEAEVNRRLETYYWPYYRKIEELLKSRREEFGNVVLWDAHSIRRVVKSIRKEPFPDMILGTNEGRSARPDIISLALGSLRKGPYQVNYNDPFKGGHITRFFGRPEENVHGLQLEMNKVLYMDDEEVNYHPDRANEVRKVLQPTFERLLEVI
ncbi:N-formylglutamate amidohydrolase [Parvicella tangerina]|nr:N-formylglutamate amidohydrolase [Parvicella tangerina]